MVQPVIKLAIRRREHNKNKAKEADISLDENFEQQLEAIIEEVEVENNENYLDEIVNNNSENNNDNNSNEIQNNNVENNNILNSETLPEKPKN
jgi:tyrosyl-tRNA synthetase